MASQDNIDMIGELLRGLFMTRARQFAKHTGTDNWASMYGAMIAMNAYNSDKHWATDICIKLPVGEMIDKLADSVRALNDPPVVNQTSERTSRIPIANLTATKS